MNCIFATSKPQCDWNFIHNAIHGSEFIQEDSFMEKPSFCGSIQPMSIYSHMGCWKIDNCVGRKISKAYVLLTSKGETRIAILLSNKRGSLSGIFSLCSVNWKMDPSCSSVPGSWNVNSEKYYRVSSWTSWLQKCLWPPRQVPFSFFTLLGFHE